MPSIIPDLPDGVQSVFMEAVDAYRRFDESSTYTSASDRLLARREAVADIAAAKRLLDRHDPKLAEQAARAAQSGGAA